MRKALSIACLTCVLFVKCGWGTTDKYRLILRDDPATTAIIGFNLFNGGTATLYWDSVDHGTNVWAYANSSAPNRIVQHKGMNNHFVRLTGLQPQQEYYFVIVDSNSTSSRFWFRTAPNSSAERLSFVAGGDSRNNRMRRRNANRTVRALRPHAVLFGGDMTNGNTDTEWQEWFDDWQYTVGVDGRMIPIVAARGNHESADADVYNLFDTPTSLVYYALTFGGNLIRVYTLNTESTIGGAQTTWLSNDLTTHSSVIWKAAQYHKPIRPHVSTKAEGSNQYTNWASLFMQHEVKLVVECDAHTVKTTYPVIPFTGPGGEEGFKRDDSLGTTYVGEGCWGAPIRANDDNKSWTRASGSFNQVKWIFVDRCQIEVRTIRTDSATSFGTVNDSNVFITPANLDVWNPSTGEVVRINHPLSPTVSITAPSAGLAYQAVQQISINAHAFHSSGVSQVDFYYNDTLIGSDGTLPYSINWTPPHSGTFNLTAVAIGSSCSASSLPSEVSFSWPSGVADYKSGKCKIYPNPADRILFVKSSERILDFRMYTLQGQLVKSIRVSGKQEYKFGLAEILQGVYLVKVVTDKGKYSDKVVLR